MDLVSIIVPVYNVERYLRRCLDSIVAQTYENIEVILVDDGSTDNCGLICDEYGQRYSFISVVHQQNQGQSAARNYGVRIAKGELVVFIDSDDFVTKDCISYLQSLRQPSDADIAIGGYRYWYEGGKIPTPKEETVVLEMKPEEAIIRLNYTRGFGAFPWGKIYKKHLLLKHPFPVGQIYEDLAVMYKIIGDSKKIVYGNKAITYWVQNESSTMRSSVFGKQMAAIAATHEQIEYMKIHYPACLQSAKARHMAKIVELVPIALRCKDADEAFLSLKKEMIYFHEVMSDKNVKKSVKIRLMAMKFGYYSTKFTFYIHEKLKRCKF